MPVEEMEFFLSLQFEVRTYKGLLFRILITDQFLASDITIITSQLYFSCCMPLGKLYHRCLSFRVYKMESRECDSPIIVRSKLSNACGLACIACLINVDKLTFMGTPGHENLSEFVNFF